MQLLWLLDTKCHEHCSDTWITKQVTEVQSEWAGKDNTHLQNIWVTVLQSTVHPVYFEPHCEKKQTCLKMRINFMKIDKIPNWPYVEVSHASQSGGDRATFQARKMYVKRGNWPRLSFLTALQHNDYKNYQVSITLKIQRKLALIHFVSVLQIIVFLRRLYNCKDKCYKCFYNIIPIVKV